MSMQRLVSGLLFAIAALIGIVALALPFLVPVLQTDPAGAQSLRTGETPLLTIVLITLCLAVLLVELQGQAVQAKTIAALGILVAIAATLRFIEVGIPGPGGFSPVFVPIILGGYVFGARFGFLLGALSMLVSALLTGGVGPWLPFQMFAAGWIGLFAGWLPHISRPVLELALLCAYGLLTGFGYGVVMNLVTWPYLAGDPALTWQAGAGLRSTLANYATYYVVTSLAWDFGRAAGNVALLLVVGLPVIRALTRFHQRLYFTVVNA